MLNLGLKLLFSSVILYVGSCVFLIRTGITEVFSSSAGSFLVGGLMAVYC